MIDLHAERSQAGMAIALDGITIGKRYEIQQHLATGGMATVFRGWDHLGDRPVAIKVLRALDEADAIDLARFRREAQVLASLHCPQIVRVCDFIEEDGRYYLILELVEGITLKEHQARRGRLPAVEALLLAAEVCQALECAHQHGFIHRDIKPQNILLAASGEVKLTDFGIVHVAGSTSLTVSGMVLGTADYLSPEQAQGLPLAPASDLYSLGIVLFEMLTGTLPFTGSSVTAVAMQHAAEPAPSLRARNASVPMRVERLVRRALAKKPEQRFLSAREMEVALRGAAVPLRSAEARSTASNDEIDAKGDMTQLCPERGQRRLEGQANAKQMCVALARSGDAEADHVSYTEAIEEELVAWKAEPIFLEPVEIVLLPEATALPKALLTLAVALVLLAAVAFLPHLL